MENFQSTQDRLFILLLEVEVVLLNLEELHLLVLIYLLMEGQVELALQEGMVEVEVVDGALEVKDINLVVEVLWEMVEMVEFGVEEEDLLVGINMEEMEVHMVVEVVEPIIPVQDKVVHMVVMVVMQDQQVEMEQILCQMD